MRRKFPLSEHHNCFRVVSNLDKAKDTLEKEIVSDDIIVSVNNKATPLIVFVQDKLVAVYNFPTNVHDDDVAAVSLSSSKASQAISRVITTFVNNRSRQALTLKTENF